MDEVGADRQPIDQLIGGIRARPIWTRCSVASTSVAYSNCQIHPPHGATAHHQVASVFLMGREDVIQHIQAFSNMKRPEWEQAVATSDQI